MTEDQEAVNLRFLPADPLGSVARAREALGFASSEPLEAVLARIACSHRDRRPGRPRVITELVGRVDGWHEVPFASRPIDLRPDRQRHDRQADVTMIDLVCRTCRRGDGAPLNARLLGSVLDRITATGSRWNPTAQRHDIDLRDVYRVGREMR